MTDRKALHDPNEPPEDVAMLYSWANLHGAKYRDFSASRAQIRERARQRAQQAIDEERERSRQQLEAQRAEETRRAMEAVLAAERAHQAELAAQQAAQLAARQAAQLAVQEAAQRAAEQAAQEVSRRAAEQAAQEARAAQAQAAQHAEAARAAQQAAQQAAWQQPVAERYAPPAPYAPPQPAAYGAPSPVMPPPQPAAPQQPYNPPPSPAPQPYNPPAAPQPGYPNYPASPAFRPAAAAPQPPAPPVPPQYEPPRENVQPLRTPFNPPETREASLRPAWLAERPSAAAPGAQTPQDTIQGSRERLTSRWFALKGVFERTSLPVVDTAPAPSTAHAPLLAVFSLAGGVGKTSMVATLGRALSSRGERVLLVDTAAFGLLPFFFGARDQRPGQLRTFSPPTASGDAPIQMVAVDPESLGQENGMQEPLSTEIEKHSRGVSRVIVDLATASGSTTRRIMRLSPLVLVPVIPDMNSVVSVGSIDAFFERNSNAAGKTLLPFYVLNQFDPSLPLHLDVREVLREQLGERLLPFTLRRAPAVSEALAEGMTVMDYAPNSTVAEDFGSLAGWVKSQSAPASSGFRGVRWSER